MVGVAQLVERWIVIPVVVGSIPIVHPIFELFNRLTFCLNGLLILYSYIAPWQPFLLIQKNFLFKSVHPYCRYNFGGKKLYCLLGFEIDVWIKVLLG